MNHFSNPFKAQFSIGSERRDSLERPLEESPRYEPVSSSNERARETRRAMQNSTSRSSRRSLSGIIPTVGSSKPKRSDEVTAKIVVREQSDRRNMRGVQPEERKQFLLKEKRRLTESISRQTGRNDRRNMKLESLRARDSAEKCEDELFETRCKELDNVHTVIRTHSSTSGEGVRNQVKALNVEIARIAEMAVETSTGKPKDQQGGLESISSFLGKPFVVFFQGDENYLADKRFTQAILQIFLARSCVYLIDAWCLEKQGLERHIGTLYGRIRGKEGQTVAGKWRQLVFEQLPHGPKAAVLPWYADLATQRLMKLASRAGWGGDTEQIGRSVLKLMKMAEMIRVDVKAGILSADLQPWIAEYGSRVEGLPCRFLWWTAGEIDKTSNVVIDMHLKRVNGRAAEMRDVNAVEKRLEEALSIYHVKDKRQAFLSGLVADLYESLSKYQQFPPTTWVAVGAIDDWRRGNHADTGNYDDLVDLKLEVREFLELLRFRGPVDTMTKSFQEHVERVAADLKKSK
ncbi:hypothetical protein AN958_10570 [Leucoagaricus sp. SymC.cos]|nr:hypothetical protein AN958_10570 [Leucoagaricus sp. SymC.cos]